MEKLIPPISSVYVLLGIVFVITLLGLLAAIVFETLAGVLDLRRKALVLAIRELFQDDKELLDSFLKHPLIRQYSSSGSGGFFHKRKLPDYINNSTFSAILIDLYQPHASAPKSLMVSFLNRLFDDCGQNVEQYRIRIEQWYQEKMEYAGSEYGKKIRTSWLFFTSLIVVTLFNAEISGLYTRITQSVDTSSNERLTAVTDNLQKLLVMDPSLDPNQVASIKEGLLYQMDVTVHPRKEPILGYSSIESVPSDAKAWLIWMLGALVSALAISFAAMMWFEIFKKSFAIVRSAQMPSPSPLIVNTAMPAVFKSVIPEQQE